MVITESNICKQQKLSGTIPSFPGLLTQKQYRKYNIYNEFNDSLIYDESMIKYQHILNQWYNDNIYTFNRSEPETYAMFGYDSATTLAMVLHEFDENYGLNKHFLNQSSVNSTFIMDKLNKTITSKINFVGITGPIHFDYNGDRRSGFYSYGGLFANNTKPVIFGVMNENGEVTIDADKIQFPPQFEHKPLSYPFVEHHKVTINEKTFHIIECLSCLSMIITFIVACLLLYFSKGTKVGVRMQLIVCFGCFLSFLGLLLYGIQNTYSDKYYDELKIFYDIGCNINILFMNIVFTLSCIPMFSFAYQFNFSISKFIHKNKLFQQNKSSEKNKLNDKDLSIRIFCALIIDFVLFSLFVIGQYIAYKFYNINLLSFKFIESGNIQETDDPLKQIQYEYGECCSNLRGVTIGFYVVFLMYKCIQIWVSLSAYSSKIIILFVFIVLTGSGFITMSTINHNSVTLHYIIESIIILILMNILLFVNIINILPQLNINLFHTNLNNVNGNNNDNNNDDNHNNNNNFSEPNIETSSLMKGQTPRNVLQENIINDGCGIIHQLLPQTTGTSTMRPLSISGCYGNNEDELKTDLTDSDGCEHITSQQQTKACLE